MDTPIGTVMSPCTAADACSVSCSDYARDRGMAVAGAGEKP